jgi:hypothetical protein
MTLLEYIVHYNTSRALREAEGKFDAADIIPKREQERLRAKFSKQAESTQGQIKIIEEAKKGFQDATLYLWLRCADRINKTFWKKYLGPNKSTQRSRIQSGAWEEWLAIAYETLTHGSKEYRDARGALDLFKPEKFSGSGDAIESFGYMLTNLLTNSAVESNYKTTTSGMANAPGIGDASFAEKVRVDSYDPAFMDSEQEAKGDHSDETFDTAFNNIELDEFWPKWKKYLQDEKLGKSKYGVSPGLIFKEVLEHPTWGISELNDKYSATSRNTIKSYLDQAVATLSDYGIDHSQLMNAIQVAGSDKLVQYMTFDEPEAPTRAKKPKPKDVGATGDDADLDKWQAFCDNPKLWGNSRKGWSAGPMMVEWILDPSYDPKKIAEEAHIPYKGYAEWYDQRMWKLLRQAGLDEAGLKRLIKKYGKKTIANMIGEVEA